MKLLLNQLLNLLFPPRCPVCDGVLPFDSNHTPHPQCLLKLKYITGPTCLKCGQPIDSSRQEYCNDCARHPHNYIQGKALFLYDGPIKLSMYLFKYGNRREYAEFFAKEIALRYKDWLDLIQPDLILPVPMYKPKERRRGYNQAEVIARALSKELGIPCHPELIVRSRDTIPQKELSLEKRKNNLKNAFYVLQTTTKYRKILLIDDIYTTGSTIDSVAYSLKKYDIQNIFFLCICIGRNLQEEKNGSNRMQRM